MLEPGDDISEVVVSPAIRQKLWELPLIPINDPRRPSGCSHCPFSKAKVGGRGPIDSPFVIVGESPGSSEIGKGYPFVGPSGEVLEHVLTEAGLYAAGIEPYITNAIQCLPPRDKNVHVMGPAVSGCQKRLYDEIAAYPRKVILALGAPAAWSCTNDFGIKITLERGKLYEHPLASVGVVTAVHPAFLMRTGSAYLMWQKDVRYAVNLLLDRETTERWNPPVWTILQDRYDLITLIGRLSHADEITGDIETGGSYGAGLNFQKGWIISLGVTSNLSGGRHVDIIPNELIWDNTDLMSQLLGLPTKWIWQNGKFDVKFFRYEGIPEARVDEDTMLLSYALNENKGHDLDTIAWDWLRAPKHKVAIEHWFKANGIARKNWDYSLPPRDLLYRYQAYDISKTHQVYYPLKEAVDKDKHLKRLYNDLLIPGSEFLTKIELKGLTLDLDRVRENSEILLQRKLEVEEKIQVYAIKHLGYRINVGSWQQLQQLLYNAMKLGPPGSSTDEDHLIQIQRKHDHPIATYLLQWRKIAKQEGTYVRPAPSWIGLDGRVHCSYKIHGTTTGRLASSDPNMQNIPRDPTIRGQFVVPPGKVLIELDLNQAELRVLTIMSGDPTLLDIYTRNEVSIHHITSVAMFGERYDDDQKMRAKAVNFGIVYGRQALSLAEEFNISVHEAGDYIRIWLERYPVAARFLEQCRLAPHEQRTMINAFGRKKRWGLVGYDNVVPSENEAANWPCQSTAHEITLRSGIETQVPIKQKWDADYVNEIHDALHIEMDDDPELYIPCARYVKSVMQDVPIRWGLTKIPFLAEAKIGTRWGRDYMKDLKL